jgi:hypothetical protein
MSNSPVAVCMLGQRGSRSLHSVCVWRLSLRGQAAVCLLRQRRAQEGEGEGDIPLAGGRELNGIRNGELES